jgi:hypothetical protein
MLADPRVWVALAVGVLAWLPLLAWNADNHDAGLKFQVVERHPWTFEWNGLWFLVIQPMLVTPILCIAMWKVALAVPAAVVVRGCSGAISAWWAACRRWASSCWASSPMSSGSVSIGRCRATWRCWWRCRWCSTAGHAGCAAPAGGWRRAGTVLAFGYYLMASTPALREQMAGSKYYPRNFAGWQPLAVAVRDELRQMPPGTRAGGQLQGRCRTGLPAGQR